MPSGMAVLLCEVGHWSGFRRHAPGAPGGMPAFARAINPYRQVVEDWLPMVSSARRRASLYGCAPPVEGAGVSVADAKARNRARSSGSGKDAAAARRWLAVTGESDFNRVGCNTAGSGVTTLTFTALAHAPMARAEARICVCSKRRRDAHAGEEARKTRRS